MLNLIAILIMRGWQSPCHLLRLDVENHKRKFGKLSIKTEFSLFNKNPTQ